MIFLAQTDGGEYEIEVQETSLKWIVTLKNKKTNTQETHPVLKKDFQTLGEFISFIFNHRSYLIDIVALRDDYTVFTRGSLKTIKLLTEEKIFFKELLVSQTPSGPSDVRSGMPGKVVDIPVKVGDKVSAGGLLLVIEAMKMENEIWASQNGIVKKIYVKTGQSVQAGAKLLSLQNI